MTNMEFCITSALWAPQVPSPAILSHSFCASYLGLLPSPCTLRLTTDGGLLHQLFSQPGMLSSQTLARLILLVNQINFLLTSLLTIAIRQSLSLPSPFFIFSVVFATMRLFSFLTFLLIFCLLQIEYELHKSCDFLCTILYDILASRTEQDICGAFSKYLLNDSILKTGKMCWFGGNTYNDVNRGFHRYCIVFINQITWFNFIFT